VNGIEGTVLAGTVLLMLAGGLLSGLVPVVNAEALLVAAVLAVDEHWWPPLVVAMAAGQSSAKVLIYLGARDRERLLHHVRTRAGVRRLLGRRRARARASGGGIRQRLPDPGRVGHLVRRPVVGALLVLCSAVAGLPPLAAMSVLAGVARMRLAVFGPVCLTGRLVRFTLIALPVAGLPGVVLQGLS
jgi:membrane protein YqaA with SNARE-associated domain